MSSGHFPMPRRMRLSIHREREIRSSRDQLQAVQFNFVFFLCTNSKPPNRIYSYANHLGFFAMQLTESCDNSFYSVSFRILREGIRWRCTRSLSLWLCMVAGRWALCVCVGFGSSDATRLPCSLVWPNKKNFMQISVIDNFSWQRAKPFDFIIICK